VSGARGREGLRLGSLDHGIWAAGMVQGLIHDIPTCAELIETIISEACDIISHRLRAFIDR